MMAKIADFFYRTLSIKSEGPWSAMVHGACLRVGPICVTWEVNKNPERNL